MELLDYLGGIKKYVNKGERVLIKPNLLMRKSYEDAVTTHPMVVRCMAEILINECEASVVIADSPGGDFTTEVMDAIYDTTGMKEIAAQTGAKLNYNFKEKMADNNDGQHLKKIRAAEFIYDADKIISIPKLKTHSMMTYTGAVKNLFGIIPGIAKAEYHLHMAGYDKFADALIDICLLAKPTLTIMDAIVSMDGNGPSAGNKKNTNTIMASADPFVLDKVCCDLIGFPVEIVPTVAQSVIRNLCKSDNDDVEIKGAVDVCLKPFQMPDSINDVFLKTDQFDDKYVDDNIKAKPACDHDKCVKCMVCKQHCPAKAISFVENKITIDLSNCIRCYCCQELCPFKAIKIRRSYLLKALLKDHEW